MPIRINLLAEAQALEDLRRRDPVKRVILAGVVLVLLILVYSSSLFAKTMVTKGRIASSEAAINSRAKDHELIIQNKKSLDEGKHKLEQLHRLSVNRFLIGDLLNALQHSTTDNVQLVRLKVSQTYVLAEETRPKPATGGEKRVLPKPATATEKIVLTLNARDGSSTAGDGVSRFQAALSSSPYFQETLGKLNEFRLIARGEPQTDPEGKWFVLFALEGRLPEKTR